MKDYECCRCGVIFQPDHQPAKIEILCPNCGSAARKVEDLIRKDDVAMGQGVRS